MLLRLCNWRSGVDDGDGIKREREMKEGEGRGGEGLYIDQGCPPIFD
jgi:hypothetical protein